MSAQDYDNLTGVDRVLAHFDLAEWTGDTYICDYEYRAMRDEIMRLRAQSLAPVAVDEAAVGMSDTECIDFMQTHGVTVISNSYGGWVLLAPKSRKADWVRSYANTSLRAAVEDFAAEVNAPILTAALSPTPEVA